MTNDNAWREAPLGRLTDHIVGIHHAYLNRELPLIGELLTAHVRQYWLQHPKLLKAHSLFAEVRALVEQHLIKEETAGFPLINAHEKDASKLLAPFVDSIDNHIDEHARVTALFAQVRIALWSYHVPDGVGAEVAYTCARLEQLEKDLAEHIHLENDILFPRVRKIA